MKLHTLLSSALVFFTLLPVMAPAQEVAQVPASQEQVKLSYAPVVKKAAPAVVNIYTRKKVKVNQGYSPFMNDPFFNQFFGGGLGIPKERVVSSLGSGVIVRPEGLIVTSYHVIKGSDEITIVLSDKREFEATLKTADEQTDLALLKVDTKGKPLPFLQLVDSDALEVGDLVLAIGNPFGVGQTVTSGIISATARAASGVSDYQFFIQTDAAINPGNSGGALVDMRGNLIGINTAIYSTSGGSNGIGFAIPANMVAAIIGGESKDGRVVKPWLGVEIQPVTQAIAESIGMESPQGVIIKTLYPDSSAAEAGLKVGDVITHIGGKPVNDEQSLNFRIGTARIGDEIAVDIIRGGVKDIVRVTLAALKERDAQQRVLSGHHPLRGITVANMTPSIARELGYPLTQTGVVVLEDAGGGGGLLFGAGIAAGDIILEVNGRAVPDTASLDRMLQNAHGKLVLTCMRGNTTMKLSFQGAW